MKHYNPCTCDTGVFCQWSWDLLVDFIYRNASDSLPKNPAVGDIHLSLTTGDLHLYNGASWASVKE